MIFQQHFRVAIFEVFEDRYWKVQLKCQTFLNLSFYDKNVWLLITFIISKTIFLHRHIQITDMKKNNME